MWWGEWARVGSRRGRPVLGEAVTEGAFVRAKTGEAEAVVPQRPGRGGWGARKGLLLGGVGSTPPAPATPSLQGGVERQPVAQTSQAGLVSRCQHVTVSCEEPL